MEERRRQSKNKHTKHIIIETFLEKVELGKSQSLWKVVHYLLKQLWDCKWLKSTKMKRKRSSLLGKRSIVILRSSSLQSNLTKVPSKIAKQSNNSSMCFSKLTKDQEPLKIPLSKIKDEEMTPLKYIQNKISSVKHIPKFSPKYSVTLSHLDVKWFNFDEQEKEESSSESKMSKKESSQSSVSRCSKVTPEYIKRPSKFASKN